MYRTVRRAAFAVAALAALSGPLGGCALFGSDPGPAYRERPVEVLYGFAAQLLDVGLWQESILYFREVERQHPFSEWARRSMLMGAYASYRLGAAGSADGYNDAISEAERFIALHPGHIGAPYAYYLRAICYYEQIVDVGRDQGSTEQAQAALREVVRRYPNTDYAADARSKLNRVDDHLAGKEMTVGRFYLRNGDTLAAMNRFKTVIDRYQTTSHVPEALYRLVETDLTLGLTEEATRNAAVLGANYPSSEWYADAYALLTSERAGPAAGGRSQTRRLRNLFGILPSPEDRLPIDPEATIRPPAADQPAA